MTDNSEKLTLLQGGSPANLSALPGSKRAKEMTVTSGLKCSALLKNSNPLGSLVKMLLESSMWHSTRCYLTWRTKVTKSNQLLFQLVPKMPRIDVIGSGFWPTPKSQVSGMSAKTSGRHFTKSTQLAMQVAISQGMIDMTTGNLYGTPRASDGMTNKLRKAENIKNPRGRLEDQVAMGTVKSGYLNPEWIEWLMGYPIGWTELEASETP